MIQIALGAISHNSEFHRLCLSLFKTRFHYNIYFTINLIYIINSYNFKKNIYNII